jgi:hypothetical protein
VLVGEGGRTRADDLADRSAGDVQVADAVLDRTAPGEELAPDARNRVHALHPPPPVRPSRRAVCESKLQEVRIARRNTVIAPAALSRPVEMAPDSAIAPTKNKRIFATIEKGESVPAWPPAPAQTSGSLLR